MDNEHRAREVLREHGRVLYRGYIVWLVHHGRHTYYRCAQPEIPENYREYNTENGVFSAINRIFSAYDNYIAMRALFEEHRV